MEGTQIVTVGSANVEYTCVPLVGRGSIGVLRELEEKVDVRRIRFVTNGGADYGTVVTLADRRQLEFTIPGDDFRPLVAGSCVNGAWALQALGHSVATVVALGGGNNGQFIAGTLAEHGISCLALPLGNTPTTVVLRLPGGGGRASRMVYLIQKPPYPIKADDVREVKRKVAVHAPDVICAFGIRSSEAALVEMLFTQHPKAFRYLIVNIALLRGSGRKHLRALAAHADALQCNEGEARALLELSGGHALTVHDAQTIAETYKVDRVVITCGSQGSVAYWDEESFMVPAYPIPQSEAIDPTGAGDVFAVGVIDGYFIRGLDPRTALGIASYCGAMNCKARGGHGNVPTRAQVDEYLEMVRR